MYVQGRIQDFRNAGSDHRPEGTVGGESCASQDIFKRKLLRGASSDYWPTFFSLGRSGPLLPGSAPVYARVHVPAKVARCR